METVTLRQLLRRYLREIIAAIQHFKKQFVALFAVFAHQRTERFHRRCLYLLEAIELVDLLDGIKYIIALGHLHRREVARSLRDIWFHKNNSLNNNHFLTIVCSRSGPMEMILIGVSSCFSRNEI